MRWFLLACLAIAVMFVALYLLQPGSSGTGLELPPVVVLDPIMAQEPSAIDIVVERLKLEEGLRLDAYRDSGGVLTIGYGFNLEVPMDAVERGYLDGHDPTDGVTEEQAEWLLRHRAERAVEDFQRRWPPYADQPLTVRVALADMAYELGDTGLAAFHTMLRLLEQGDYTAAADDALQTLWAREVPNRARRVTDLFRSAAP